jgi:hypothetical protein
VTVTEAAADGLTVTVSGTLAFGEEGNAPFAVVVRGQKDAATLSADFSFAPLTGKKHLVLREAGLRFYAAFPKEPKKPLWLDVGEVLGGRIVESPWAWKEWVSWGRNCGPVTMREGRFPDAELNYHLHDERMGMSFAVNEPAAVAPFEFFGDKHGRTITAYAWPPRSRPLPMTGPLPERFEVKNIGVIFFKASGGNDRSRVLEAARQTLRTAPAPLASNLRDPRLTDSLRENRIAELKARPKRGWAGEIAATPFPNAPVMSSPDPLCGPGWTLLELDAPYATAAKNIPVRGGIPFPKGALTDVRHLRLLNADGTEVSCQADRSAVWPDGSVKWVLLTAFADAGPETPTRFKLEYGPQIVRKATGSGKLDVVTADAGVTVDTGVLRFNVRKDGDGFFDEAWLDADGDGKYSDAEKIADQETNARRNVMDLAVLKTAAAYGSLEFHGDLDAPERSTAKVETIAVERQGPLYVRLKISGRHHYKTLGRGRGKYKNQGCEFWVWLTAYAGKPYLEIKHAYVYEGNPDVEMIADLSLSFKPELNAEVAFTAAGDGRETTTKLQAGGRAGIHQTGPHAFELWSAETAEAKETVPAAGRSAAGWADVSDGTRGVTFGIREMPERHEKSVSYENGRALLGLWPKRAKLLDTRRYAHYFGTGESTSKGLGAAQGVSRTHDLFVIFHAGSAQDASVAATAQAFLKPAYLKAYPTWYAAANAAGPFQPYDMEKFPKWEKILRDGADYMLYHQRLWSWNGHYDYGDFQQCPAGGGWWQKLVGRWGWVNNESLLDMWLHEQFMRTGRRDYLDAATAMSRHVQEVDLIHTHDYKGYGSFKMRGHRHNVNHWGDGFVGVRVGAAHGFRLGYFLTGDAGIYHNLEESLPAYWRRLDKSDGNPGAPLGILNFFWEATGDNQYFACLNAYVDFQVAHYRKFGSIFDSTWDYRRNSFDGNVGDIPAGEPPTSFFYQNFGGAYSMMEMAEVMARPDLVEALLRFADDTTYERGGWEASFCHQRLLAFAYRHSGDRKYLDQALKNVERISVPEDRSKWAYGSGIGAFTDKVSMLGWTCQGLPYLMRAQVEMQNHPAAAFASPPVLRIPAGKAESTWEADGSASKAVKGALADYEWFLDGKSVAKGVKASFQLTPGTRTVRLAVTDAEGRKSMTTERIFVWESGVVAQIYFTKGPPNFVRCGPYDEAQGYGWLPGANLRWPSEPRQHGGKGCNEAAFTGTVQVKTGPGTFELETGGTEFWSYNYGPVFVQDKEVVQSLAQPSPNRRVSWEWKGEAIVGDDGLLKIRFGETEKKEPGIVAYIIVRKKP